MPSTVVHVAFAGLVAAALLADHFDGGTVLVVMAATAFLDLDVIVGFWIAGAHRAAFHTLLLPGLVGATLWWDLRGRAHPRVQSRTSGFVRERSLVRSRWGARGVRTAWVSVAAMTLAGVGPDAAFNGANLFYPVHDRFYELSGKVLYSTHDGFVQTIVTVDLDALADALVPDLSGGGSGAGEAGGSNGGGAGGGGESSDDGGTVRTTENTHYRTGFDPTRGDEPANVERVFPVAMTGERALLALTGYAVVGVRLWEERRGN